MGGRHEGGHDEIVEPKPSRSSTLIRIDFTTERTEGTEKKV